MTKWMDGWRSNDWCKRNGSPLANESDFRDLDSAMSGMNIQWKYVQAHSGDRFNELADRLAKNGARD